MWRGRRRSLGEGLGGGRDRKAKERTRASRILNLLRAPRRCFPIMANGARTLLRGRRRRGSRDRPRRRKLCLHNFQSRGGSPPGVSMRKPAAYIPRAAAWIARRSARLSRIIDSRRSLSLSLSLGPWSAHARERQHEGAHDGTPRQHARSILSTIVTHVQHSSARLLRVNNDDEHRPLRIVRVWPPVGARYETSGAALIPSQLVAHRG